MPCRPSTPASASGLGHETHPELAQDAVAVDHGGTVHLGEGVAQGSEVARPTDVERGRRWQAQLDRRGGRGIGPVGEDRTDAARPEVVHGELQEALDHLAVAVRLVHDLVEPRAERRLVMPVRPAQRSTPNSPTMRTVPLGWRWTTVAPIASASTTRSRSDPAGRSNTAHSSSPLTRRMSQLARPSANSRRRSAASPRRVGG